MRTIARLVLSKNDIDYDLSEGEDRYADLDRIYKRLKGLVDGGDINDTGNLLTDELDAGNLDCLEIAPTLYMYLNQLKDSELYTTSYSREETVDGVNSVCTEYDISGFEYFVDIAMV